MFYLTGRRQKTVKAENGKLHFWNLAKTKTEKAENRKLHFLQLGGS